MFPVQIIMVLIYRYIFQGIACCPNITGFELGHRFLVYVSALSVVIRVVCLVLGMPFLCYSCTNSRTCLSLTLIFACFGPQDAFGLHMLAS